MSDDEEWSTPELKRLYELILDDIQHQNALHGFGLPESAIDALASSVATQVAYGFDMTWSPKWLGPDDPGRTLAPLA